jgi:hypothetical protein
MTGCTTDSGVWTTSGVAGHLWHDSRHHGRQHSRQHSRQRRSGLHGANPLGQVDHAAVRRQVELLRQQHLVDARLLEGRDAVVGADERFHQAERRLPIERVERREATPPFDRGRVVVPLFSAPSELLEGGGVVAREAGALRLHPSLEAGSAGQMEAVEELTLVDRDRAFQVARTDGRVELGDVGDDLVRREYEVAGARDRLVAPDLLAQGVKRLVQSFPRALLVGVCPEEAHQPLARHAAMPGGGEDGEQREPARLGSRTRDARPIPLQENLT